MSDRQRASRMVRVGAAVVLASALVVAMPAVVPLGWAAKYVVVPGLIGVCFGLSCVLNGWIDARRGGE